MTYGDQVYLFGRALQKHRISCLPPCLVPWDHSEAVPVRWGSPSTATVWQCFLLSVTQFDDLLSLISPRRRRKESMIVSIQIRNISQSSAGEWSDLPPCWRMPPAVYIIKTSRAKAKFLIGWPTANSSPKSRYLNLLDMTKYLPFVWIFAENALSPDCRGWRSHLIVSVNWLNIEPWN